MSVIRRCDNCRTETIVPSIFNGEADDWFCLFRPGDEQGLNFCQEKCVTDYFLSKSLIEEIS